MIPQHQGLGLDLSDLLGTSASQRWKHPEPAFAGHRRLRFSFFADKLDAAGARLMVRSGFGPVAQVVRAHP